MTVAEFVTKDLVLCTSTVPFGSVNGGFPSGSGYKPDEFYF